MRFSLSLLAPSASVAFALASPKPVVDGNLSKLEAALTRSAKATWYNTGLENCDVGTNNNNDPIVAITKRLYDRNGGINCGQYIQITSVANGKTAIDLVEDSCPSCSEGDIDLSPSLFQKLAPLDQGIVQASWNFKNKNRHP